MKQILSHLLTATLIALAASPSLAAMIKVPIARPRNQLATKEHPDFLKLRRELYQFLGHH